jgi:hypothetical protein
MHRFAVPPSKSQPFQKEHQPMKQNPKRCLFPLGQIVGTPGALAALRKAGQGPPEFLARHASGDWGDLCAEDREANQFSMERGFQIFSSYRTHAGDELWVITDNHFSITTILLPDEY